MPPQIAATIFSDRALKQAIQGMGKSVFALLCSKGLWLSNSFDLWSLTEVKQTMQPISCFFFLVLSILHWGNKTLPLEELVTCVVYCPDRYICNKSVFNLCNYIWLQFIPLSWGIFQSSECLANSGPWLMNHSGCLYPVQRQRCSHTCTSFLRKVDFHGTPNPITLLHPSVLW